MEYNRNPDASKKGFVCKIGNWAAEKSYQESLRDIPAGCHGPSAGLCAFANQEIPMVSTSQEMFQKPTQTQSKMKSRTQRAAPIVKKSEVTRPSGNGHSIVLCDNVDSPIRTVYQDQTSHVQNAPARDTSGPATAQTSVYCDEPITFYTAQTRQNNVYHSKPGSQTFGRNTDFSIPTEMYAAGGEHAE